MKIWSLERQFVGVGIISIIVLAIVGSGLFYARSRASCTDNIQNGTEEGVDCGGSCPSACIGNPREPQLLWARFFPVTDSTYDVGAYVENLNLTLGSGSAQYEFKLYDKDNVLLSKRIGATPILPNQKTFVYEPRLDTKGKSPARVDFSIHIPTWEFIETKDTPEIEIVEKQFVASPYPSVHATILNRAIFDEPKLEVSVLLERFDGTVYEASRTVLEHLGDHERRDIVFTWPESSFEQPANIVILYRRLAR